MNNDRTGPEPTDSTGPAATDLESEAEAFANAKERAIEAIDREDVRSMYVGLIDEEGGNEFYFGNAPEGDLQHAAVTQLGMLTQVLASQSDTNVEHVAQLAAKRAREMELR